MDFSSKGWKKNRELGCPLTTVNPLGHFTLLAYWRERKPAQRSLSLSQASLFSLVLVLGHRYVVSGDWCDWPTGTRISVISLMFLRTHFSCPLCPTPLAKGPRRSCRCIDRWYERVAAIGWWVRVRVRGLGIESGTGTPRITHCKMTIHLSEKLVNNHISFPSIKNWIYRKKKNSIHIFIYFTQ